jgi:hypothetical protein
MAAPTGTPCCGLADLGAGDDPETRWVTPVGGSYQILAVTYRYDTLRKLLADEVTATAHMF